MGSGERRSGRRKREEVIRETIVRRELVVGGTGTGASARATYTVYTDSGGMIPTFIKNTGSQIGIRKLFAAIRKQVRDPKYAEGCGGEEKAELDRINRILRIQEKRTQLLFFNPVNPMKICLFPQHHKCGWAARSVC